MQEGILNKIGRILYTKQVNPNPQEFDRMSWSSYLCLLAQNVSNAQVEWNDWGNLLNLNYNSTADCLDIISDCVSSVNIQLFRESTKTNGKTKVSKDYREWLDSYSYIKTVAKTANIEEIDTYPPLELLKNINAKMNESNAIAITSKHLELTGNGYWKINRSDGGIPALIRFIPPNTITDIEEDVDGTPLKYYYGKDKWYDAKDILHFWFIGPWSTKWGCGRAYKSSGWANVQKNITTYLASNFKNMGIPAAAVISKSGMTEKQFDTFKKQFDQLYKGVIETGKTAFLTGDIEIIKLGFTPDEMGVDMTWRLAREAIANSHSIPISKLTDASNRAVAERHDVQFLRDTATPILMNICQELTESYLPMFGNTEGMFFAIPDIVPEDQTAALNERKANLEAGVTTYNEERAAMGKEPYKDPNADLLWIPSTKVPIGTLPQNLAKQITDNIMDRVQNGNTD